MLGCLFLSVLERSFALHAVSRRCHEKAERFWSLVFYTWPFFFPFLPRTCRVFLFPKSSKFRSDFPVRLCLSVVLSSCCILSSADNFSPLAPVFLPRTPIIWVLYFLDHRLFFFHLYLLALFLSNFFNFNFQPVCWVFISVIVLNFLFSSINS